MGVPFSFLYYYKKPLLKPVQRFSLNAGSGT